MFVLIADELNIHYQLLEEGPFSFRIRTEPLENHTIEVEGVGVRTIHPPLTKMMMNERLQRGKKTNAISESSEGSILNVASCTIL